ncbi:MAG: class II glutamine amidotransferase [Planctomycetales bacterium]|nr:class II glutamine amidotransferase [Planctomycetales bacterium]
MCRLYAFRSNEPTKVECSLVHAQNALLAQSRSDSIGRRHADGWGIVCYKDGEPTVNRRANAAFEDAHFNETAERVYSTAVVAHVRLSTVGVNSPSNTHPFTFDRWTFAHNGTIPSFCDVEKQLNKRIDAHLLDSRFGTTDSELYFLWLLHCLNRNGLLHDAEQSPSESAQVIAEAILELVKLCRDIDPDTTEKLNFVLTNGSILFACRWNNTLFEIFRDGIYDCEICGIPHVQHDSSVNYQAIAIASEPITHEPWTAMRNHTLLCVTKDLARFDRPIEASFTAKE